MAEAEAGQGNAQEQGGENTEQQEEQKPRVYSQEEVDRIAAKVRKNAARDTEIKVRREFQPPQRETVKTEQEPPKKAEPPKREDFESYEEYLRADAKFEARAAAKEELETSEKEKAAERSKESQAQAAREFKKRAESAAKEIPDFIDVIESAEDVHITSAMGEAIAESEIGPRILYHLAKNPAEAERIAGLSRNGQLMAIGKIEDRLEAEIKKAATKDEGDEEKEPDGDDPKGGDEPASEEKRNKDGTFKSPQSRKAPDPIEPTGGRSASNNRGPSDKDDVKSWMAKRDAEEAAARRAKRGG
jgi:hypothetical protein